MSLKTGSIAGNLCIKKMYPEFPSDVFILLETIGARIIVAEGIAQMVEMSVAEFMSDAMDMKKRVLAGLALPKINSATNHVVTYKVRIIITKKNFKYPHSKPFPVRSCPEPKTRMPTLTQDSVTNSPRMKKDKWTFKS